MLFWRLILAVLYRYTFWLCTRWRTFSILQLGEHISPVCSQKPPSGQCCTPGCVNQSLLGPEQCRSCATAHFPLSVPARHRCARSANGSGVWSIALLFSGGQEMVAAPPCVECVHEKCACKPSMLKITISYLKKFFHCLYFIIDHDLAKKYILYNKNTLKKVFL